MPVVTSDVLRRPPPPVSGKRTVRFFSKEVPAAATALLTGPAVVLQHHHEGWQQVQRMMRMSFTEWQGAPGYEIQIPIVFNGLAGNVSEEHAIRQLESLAEPWPRKFDPLRSPIIKFDSFGDIPHDFTRDPWRQWVIAGTGIEWGDYISNKQFQRVRQIATVHLWEWFGEDVMVVSLHNQQYKVKKGDTLQHLAVKYYGDRTMWRKIAKANKIRDPNHLKVGRVIKFP